MSDTEETNHATLTLSVNADAHVVSALFEQAKGLEVSVEWLLSQMQMQMEEPIDRATILSMLCLCIYQMGEQEETAEEEHVIYPEPIRVPGNETTIDIARQEEMNDYSARGGNE